MLKEDLATAEAKLASKDEELQEHHEEVSRVRHEQQLLQHQVADLNTRAKQRSRNLERAEAENNHSLKSEINLLSRQLAIRGSSKTPMSAMTRSLPGAGSTNRRGMENDDSSEITPQRGRHNQRAKSGSA